MTSPLLEMKIDLIIFWSCALCMINLEWLVHTAHGGFFFYEIWQAHCPCIKKRRTNKVRIQKSAAAEKTNRNTEKEERPKLLRQPETRTEANTSRPQAVGQLPGTKKKTKGTAWKEQSEETRC
jgi:hypothetical protein